jgi:protein-L-isoaspartate(D-aspartate) O-methyltransferase
MNVGFISCSGASERKALGHMPTKADFAAVRSIWIGRERPPDQSAVALYDNVWFSSEEATS